VLSFDLHVDPTSTNRPDGAPPGLRTALRTRLLSERERFAAGPDAAAAALRLATRLSAVLLPLEAQCLGLYWPHRCEFNAAGAIAADSRLAKIPLALPFAQRAPPRMHYRVWDGLPPRGIDDCGIAASDGAVVVPDVVLVPCVGFTAGGHRLGYGGGFFDRWLADHPHVTSVGVAWAHAAIEADAFEPQPHDQPLTLVVTEDGVV
jgi:5,10-methenyltetrahydrofolate synthetase